MEGRKQFTFYRSYLEAIRELPKREQTAVLLAVCAYALDCVEPELTGTAKAVFTLIRPTLDASSRKAKNGLLGGLQKKDGSKTEASTRQTESKTEANAKQTPSEKEKENEKKMEKEKENEMKTELENEPEPETETESENEGYPRTPLTAAEKAKRREEEAFGQVMSAYMERIAAIPSGTCAAALRDFCAVLGPEVCLRAIDTAIDAQKPTWPYINAILRDKQARGIDSLEKWDKQEQWRRPAASAPETPETQSGQGEAERKAAEDMVRLWERIQREEREAGNTWTPPKPKVSSW